MKRIIKKLIEAVDNFMKAIKEDSISAYSAQAAFFIIISAFPLIMLLLTLLKYLPYFSDGTAMIEFDMIPNDVNVFITEMVNEIIAKSTGTVLSVTAVTTLWSASKGVYSIMQGLTAAYSIEETRNYFKMRFLSVVYTAIFVVMIIAALGCLVFGNTIYQALINYLPIAAENIRIISRGIKWLLGLGVLVLMFDVLYIAMPNRKSTIFQELPGALLSAVGWVGFSYIYSFYIDNFSNYANIYGSLTAVVLLMLWLYFCMYIMLLGAEVNVAWNGTYRRIVARIYRNTKKKIKSKID